MITSSSIIALKTYSSKLDTFSYLSNINLACVHEFQDCGEVGEGDVLENDDRVLGGVLLQEVLEVGRAGTENHLVGLGMLALKNVYS